MPPRKRRDPSEMSTRREQMRIRIRRAGERADAEIDNFYRQLGHPIENWDWEELARGRPRDKNGKFTGRPPGWVTENIKREAKRRLMSGVYGELGEQSKYALQVLRELVTEDGVDDRVRFDAARYIIDHIIGKPKAILELDGSDTVRNFLAKALVLDDGQPEHRIIEGEYTHDDDGEDDDDD